MPESLPEKNSSNLIVSSPTVRAAVNSALCAPKIKTKNVRMKLQILHDLEIEKWNFGSLKMNEENFAWHLF